MKCIQYYPKNSALGRVERIERVSDAEADAAVSSGAAFYVSRSIWKQKVRNPQRTALFMQAHWMQPH